MKLFEKKILRGVSENACARLTSLLKKGFATATKSLKQISRPATAQAKKRCIIRCWSLGCILLFVAIPVFGKVRNGYEKNISLMKESLSYLQNVLLENKGLSSFQRRKLESSMEILLDQASYYELTENLLSQFKIVAPRLFCEIDTITDRLGRPVDVFVKFVPIDATEIKAWGTTYISQMENDKDAYVSEYGPFTVSIKIWTVPTALLVLAHEFGHVKYQVPNLASYLEFHRMFYKDFRQQTFIGHSQKDPSGKSANHAGNIFKKAYSDFSKARDEKMKNPVVLLARIRKGLDSKYYSLVKARRSAGTI